jgi:integrase
MARQRINAASYAGRVGFARSPRLTDGHEGALTAIRRANFMGQLPAQSGTQLRTTFVSLMSHQGVAIEEIARLAGHATTRTTEIVYRRELRPVITTGAEIMDQLFRRT